MEAAAAAFGADSALSSQEPALFVHKGGDLAGTPGQRPAGKRAAAKLLEQRGSSKKASKAAEREEL